MNLKDFQYREEKVKPEEIFPQFDLQKFKTKFPKQDLSNPHQLIFDTVLDLWNGGYNFILDNFSFHDQYKNFSGHCHQITPALGFVLKAFGFEKVAYLECRAVFEDTFEAIPPEDELNPEMRDEFCAIGRIPYCCLEIEINGEKFYLTGKHLKLVDGKPKALLTPTCYKEMVGVFSHQDDSAKSGIYLETIQEKPFVWRKQTSGDKKAEYFKTFAYMELEF